IRAESSFIHDHVSSFMLTKSSWQFEQLERLIECDGFNTQVTPDFCEARFLLIILCTDLHHWTVAAHARNHFPSALRINAKFSFTGYALSFLHCLIHIFVKWFVEFINNLLPFFFSVRNFIKLFFNFSSETEIHHILEILHKKII